MAVMPGVFAAHLSDGALSVQIKEAGGLSDCVLENGVLSGDRFSGQTGRRMQVFPVHGNRVEPEIASGRHQGVGQTGHTTTACDLKDGTHDDY